MGFFSWNNFAIDGRCVLLFAFVAGQILLPLCESRTLQPHEIETSLRGSETHCKKQCLLVLRKVSAKVSLVGWRGKWGFYECLRRCSNKHFHGRRFSKFLIIPPGGAVPNNIVWPEKRLIPDAPKELLGLLHPALRTHGDCNLGHHDIDTSMNEPVKCKVLSVLCDKKLGAVLVKWDKPFLDAKRLIGYQINYSFTDSRKRIYRPPRSACYQVEQNKSSFLMDRSKGFQGQRSVNLAITALPVPSKYDITLTRYSLCKDDVPVIRKRRYSFPNFTAPDVVIISEGDVAPTGLIIPSTMPKLSVDLRKENNPDSNCESPKLHSNNSVYAGKVDILSVDCREAGKFNKKGFQVYWKYPKDYKTIQFTGFQIFYSIMKKNSYDPRKQICHQVSKQTTSFTITNVEETDTLHVAVIAYPTYSKLNVFMEKFRPCANKTFKAPLADNDGRSYTNVLVPSIAVPIVLIAIAIFIIWYHRRNPGPVTEPPEKGQFYVSYYPDSKAYHEKLLLLIAKLRKCHSLNIIIDSLCQVDVGEFGLPRWCQRQLTDAAKIIVVVSREYLKICKDWEALRSEDVNDFSSTDANRVCWELQYVVNQIFECRTNKRVLIILADDVKVSDLPEFLRGRQTQAWPRTPNDINSLACKICGVEETIA
eukprot:gene18177-19991_t